MTATRPATRQDLAPEQAQLLADMSAYIVPSLTWFVVHEPDATVTTADGRAHRLRDVGHPPLHRRRTLGPHDARPELDAHDGPLGLLVPDPELVIEARPVAPDGPPA